MNRSLALSALLAGLLSAGPLEADADPDTAATLSRLGTLRRDAARKTYEVTWANYRDRRASADTLYRWSLRWLESERQLSDKQADQLAAFKGHWERMRDLERL